MSLVQLLKDKIQDKGPIPFQEFMQMALYHPHYGYYSGPLPKFGPEGDFITAPELSPIFAYALANQCAQILKNCPGGCILEFGAGSGKLCVDLLTRLADLKQLPEKYYILELSPTLTLRQQQWVETHLPSLKDRVEWLKEWPNEPISGVFIANEVLDAMPVHRFMRYQDTVYESFITVNEQDILAEIFKPCENSSLKTYVEGILPVTNQPYISEANLWIEGWLNSAKHCLNQGVLLILDYGFPKHEYYLPERNQGTLICHYQHRAHNDFLLNVGEQDITAHVDFTHVAEKASALGFEVSGYTSQASFLIANGLLETVHSDEVTPKYLEIRKAVQLLTSPSEMGELFKVIALSYKMDLSLQGFSLIDRRSTL